MATDGGIPIRYDTRGSAMAASEAASAQASGCGRSPCASRLAYEHRSKCSASHPSPTSCLGQRKYQVRRAGLARGVRQAALCHGRLCNLGKHGDGERGGRRRASSSSSSLGGAGAPVAAAFLACGAAFAFRAAFRAFLARLRS